MPTNRPIQPCERALARKQINAWRRLARPAGKPPLHIPYEVASGIIQGIAALALIGAVHALILFIL